MNRTLFKTFTPTLLGAVTVTSVGIFQTAQAQTINAESRVSFTQSIFTITDENGNNPENFWSQFSAETQALASLFPPSNLDDSQVQYVTPCNSTPIPANSLVNRTLSSAEGGANVDCSNPQTIANNFAEINLLDTSINNETASALGGYEIFNQFDALGGQTVTFDGVLDTFLSASVEGYSDPTGAIAQAEFLAQLTIDRVIDSTTARVFTGDVFSDGLLVEDMNDSLNNQAFAGVAIPTQTFTLPEDGRYEIRFSAVERAGGVEPNTEDVGGVNPDTDSAKVPEPSNLASLILLGGVAFYLKRHNSG